MRREMQNLLFSPLPMKSVKRPALCCMLIPQIDYCSYIIVTWYWVNMAQYTYNKILFYLNYTTLYNWSEQIMLRYERTNLHG